MKLDQHLLARDCIRSSTFQVSEFGAEWHTSSHDVIYDARDVSQESERSSNAYMLSSLVHLGLNTYPWSTPPAGYLWRSMSLTPTMVGPNRALKQSDLRYSATLVSEGLNLSLWPWLHKTLSYQRFSQDKKFTLMMWLSTLAAATSSDLCLLQILALFITTDSVSQISAPAIEAFHPAQGYLSTKPGLRYIVRDHLLPLQRSPEANLQKNENEKKKKFQARQKRMFAENQSRAVEGLVDLLHRQWPQETFPTLDLSSQPVTTSHYIDVDKAVTATKKKFSIWLDNLQLFNYLRSIENEMARLSSHFVDLPTSPAATPVTTTPRRGYISTPDLFAGPAPVLLQHSDSLADLSNASSRTQRSTRLNNLIESLHQASGGSRYEISYIADLQDSLASLHGKETVQYLDLPSVYSDKCLLENLRECTQHVNTAYSTLSSAVNSAAAINAQFINSSIVCEIGQLPRISPAFFLRQLSRDAWSQLGSDWRTCIVEYGLALAALQRGHRLLKAASSEDLINELRNVGHTNWSPLDSPESLLLEVESNITIRQVQAEIAAEMAKPPAGRNTVMQLNMGEGKSSVIVPMVAATLANSSQLVRVVVAKPQSKQMAQMLISKLGGLIGRRIYYMPFSRALKLDESTAAAVGQVLRECMSQGGVLLVQPEHILSFKLMGLECYNLDKTAVGRSLLLTQDFFDKKSRDLLDESDDLLSVKFELIYTMGSQRSIELSPDRWILIQQVLALARSTSASIVKTLPSSMEHHDSHPCGFARIRILKSDAEKLLLHWVARHICETGLEGFPISRQPEDVREAIFVYMTKSDLTTEEIKKVEEAGPGKFWTDSTKPKLLQLRGLLAEGVLAFALGQKRWRVNYGLVSTRTPPTKLAVPYRAKDNPTPRSEFSHPDVVIVLTSLSYYYGGLENEDIFMAFHHLTALDQAAVEYQAWIKDAPNMPSAFRQLEGVNLKDRSQCVSEIFPHLRYSKSAIDYFLSQIVFPKEMKEFPHKLSASGWDISKIKSRPTTGFSGTNDSRKLLPLDVEQLDLPEQRHTNALVLDYLLQPENAVVVMPRQDSACATDAERLLTTVINFDKPTQVILDVGAQILELDNEQVAQRWLEIHPDDRMQAVVFVNRDDEVSVLDRKGRVESLQTSSFATQLDVCLVFLDEAHTRGIDLKLPVHYRAAVTLGAKLTKDRMVQACMRLRKLGKGQTVVFCVTDEIKTKIEACTSKQPDAQIGLADVLHWAISETFDETRRSMPLWAVQGERFSRQQELWNEVHTNGITCMSKTQSQEFLEDEAQTVNQRYRPQKPDATARSRLTLSTGGRIEQIKQRCSEFDNLQFNSSTLQEEQERELSPEIEEEKQIEPPAPAQPAEHHLHSDVENFVSYGVVSLISKAYMNAFCSVADTSAADDFEVTQLAGDGHLLVTEDFARTVEVSIGKGHRSDDYQRPVQWVLTSRAGDSNTITYMMIISPFEAQHLMPKIQKVKNVALHLYKPRCNISYRSFDRLNFYTIPTQTTKLQIPRSLLIQLDLFAGQLYLSSYEDYLEACAFLKLAASVPKKGEVIAADGFIERDSNGEKTRGTSPVKFLQMLMSKIRRNGQSISKTHMGSMLEGKILERVEFET